MAENVHICHAWINVQVALQPNMYTSINACLKLVLIFIPYYRHSHSHFLNSQFLTFLNFMFIFTGKN